MIKHKYERRPRNASKVREAVKAKEMALARHVDKNLNTAIEYLKSLQIEVKKNFS